MVGGYRSTTRVARDSAARFFSIYIYIFLHGTVLRNNRNIDRGPGSVEDVLPQLGTESLDTWQNFRCRWC